MSISSRRARFAAAATAFAAAAALTLGSLPAAAVPPEPANPLPAAEPGRYIVTLKGKPIATYGGEVTGFKATRPAKGGKVSVTTTRAKRYRAYLERQQDLVAARVGVKADKHYALSLNGFGTSLTPDQAQALKRAPGVMSVVKDKPRQLTNDQNPIDFLGLSGNNGVWSAIGGKSKAGRGVVVGVIDTGYWPESASFAGDPLGTAPPTASDPYRPYKAGAQVKMTKSDGNTFTGACQPGATAEDRFTGAECNSKVISARYFAETFQQAVPAAQRRDWLSPRDGDGHGSHTGSTAAGNADVPASVEANSYGNISGVAPAAKLAVYKVCFTSTTANSCYTGDSLDAVDQAILDGVDVINYSISSADDLADPVDIAFLSAASAGIFVATSAGNSGPGPSTLNHVGPWQTTVAASTVAPYAGTVELGNGAKYAGISTTVQSPVGPAPLITGAAAKAAAATAANGSQCQLNTLDPAKTVGKIVVCDRGGNARVEKSDEVKRAGGVGMVLVNLTENSRDADTHAVPTVHLNIPESLDVRRYADTPGATASLKKGNLSGTPIVYPQVAGFSSRGPALGVAGDLLKPDIAAPGVATLAAVAPPSNRNRDFDFYSGTSMAAPHVAGLAALYFGVRPRWSAMAVKSAMMTTSARLRNADNSVSRDYYAQGAGNVRPDRMFNPGVIFDAGDEDWLGFIEGVGYETGIPGVEAIDPSDYNSPSIAIGKLVGSQTVTRRVTALKAGLYRATINLPGVNATVSPSILTFTSAGQTKTIKVKFSRKNAPLSEVDFGSLYIRGAGTQARVPIAVTPEALDAPAVVTGTGASGSTAYQIRPGFSGPFPVKPYGLDAATVVEADISASSEGPAGEPDEYTTEVPAGTKVARFDIASADDSADIDLEVYRVVDGVAELVGTSATGSGSERVTLLAPEPGQYLSVVYPYADPAGQSSTVYTYRDFVVPATAAGNYTVTPANATVTQDRPLTLTASWSGLDAAVPYLGYVEYIDGSYTLVEIN